MRFEPFAMERMQSTWENRVAWNLSESGVHPLRVEELADTTADRSAVLAQELAYTRTNGSPELRSEIAALYPGATTAHVEVTNGGAEANFVVLAHLLEPGDEVVVMMPNYMQIPGVSRTLGAQVRAWPLAGGEGRRWRTDLALPDTPVSPTPTALAIANP